MKYSDIGFMLTTSTRRFTRLRRGILVLMSGKILPVF